MVDTMTVEGCGFHNEQAVYSACRQFRDHEDTELAAQNMAATKASQHLEFVEGAPAIPFIYSKRGERLISPSGEDYRDVIDFDSGSEHGWTKRLPELIRRQQALIPGLMQDASIEQVFMMSSAKNYNSDVSYLLEFRNEKDRVVCLAHRVEPGAELEVMRRLGDAPVVTETPEEGEVYSLVVRREERFDLDKVNEIIMAAEKREESGPQSTEEFIEKYLRKVDEDAAEIRAVLDAMHPEKREAWIENTLRKDLKEITDEWNELKADELRPPDPEESLYQEELRNETPEPLLRENEVEHREREPETELRRQLILEELPRELVARLDRLPPEVREAFIAETLAEKASRPERRYQDDLRPEELRYKDEPLFLRDDHRRMQESREDTVSRPAEPRPQQDIFSREADVLHLLQAPRDSETVRLFRPDSLSVQVAHEAEKQLPVKSPAERAQQELKARDLLIYRPRTARDTQSIEVLRFSPAAEGPVSERRSPPHSPLVESILAVDRSAKETAAYVRSLHQALREQALPAASRVEGQPSETGNRIERKRVSFRRDRKPGKEGVVRENSRAAGKSIMRSRSAEASYRRNAGIGAKKRTKEMRTQGRRREYSAVRVEKRTALRRDNALPRSLSSVRSAGILRRLKARLETRRAPQQRARRQRALTELHRPSERQSRRLRVRAPAQRMFKKAIRGLLAELRARERKLTSLALLRRNPALRAEIRSILRLFEIRVRQRRHGRSLSSRHNGKAEKTISRRRRASSGEKKEQLRPLRAKARTRTRVSIDRRKPEDRSTASHAGKLDYRRLLFRIRRILVRLENPSLQPGLRLRYIVRLLAAAKDSRRLGQVVLARRLKMHAVRHLLPLIEEMQKRKNRPLSDLLLDEDWLDSVLERRQQMKRGDRIGRRRRKRARAPTGEGPVVETGGRTKMAGRKEPEKAPKSVMQTSAAQGPVFFLRTEQSLEAVDENAASRSSVSNITTAL